RGYGPPHEFVLEEVSDLGGHGAVLRIDPVGGDVLAVTDLAGHNDHLIVAVGFGDDLAGLDWDVCCHGLSLGYMNPSCLAKRSESSGRYPRSRDSLRP